MTTLVAYQGTDGSAWIGSDQLVTAGDARDCLRRKFRITPSGVAFGWTGAVPIGDLLESVIGAQRTPDASEVAEATRVEMLRRGWKTNANSDVPDLSTSAFLCAPASFLGSHQLFELDLGIGCASLIEPGEFRAYGSGWRFAMGAAVALAHLAPKERLEQALRAAISLDIYSGGEPTVVGFLPDCVPQRSLADAGAGAPDAPRTVALRGDRGEDPKGETRTR